MNSRPLSEFYVELENIGEKIIRERLASGVYGRAGTKLKQVEEWLRQQDQSRNDSVKREEIAIARDAAASARDSADAARDAAEEARQANIIARIAIAVAAIATIISIISVTLN